VVKTEIFKYHTSCILFLWTKLYKVQNSAPISKKNVISSERSDENYALERSEKNFSTLHPRHTYRTPTYPADYPSQKFSPAGRNDMA
jgi:hypothetical protein